MSALQRSIDIFMDMAPGAAGIHLGIVAGLSGSFPFLMRWKAKMIASISEVPISMALAHGISVFAWMLFFDIQKSWFQVQVLIMAYKLWFEMIQFWLEEFFVENSVSQPHGAIG